MVINHMAGNMGGYYISSSPMNENGTTYMGGSGGVLYLKPTLSGEDLTISLCSMTQIPVTVLYDAANVEVTQL